MAPVTICGVFVTIATGRGADIPRHLEWSLLQLRLFMVLLLSQRNERLSSLANIAGLELSQVGP